MSLPRVGTVPEPVAFSRHISCTVQSSSGGCDQCGLRRVLGPSEAACQAPKHAPSRAQLLTFDTHNLAAQPQIPRDPRCSNTHAHAINKSIDALSSRSPLQTTAPLPTSANEQPPPPFPLNASTRVAVVGVGFVGSSLLGELLNPFPNAIGYDTSPARIFQMRQQYQTILGGEHRGLRLTTDVQDLKEASYFLIAVPTLLRSEHDHESSVDDTKSSRIQSGSAMNLGHVESAVQTVLRHCRSGSVIVLESSVSVGTTRSLLGPHSNRIHGGMSPERLDPVRVAPPPSAVPKLVSGLTPTATTAITELYSSCYEHVHPVSSPEVAEMTKLHENCFRMVNIAYANEMADACQSLGVDFKEVVDAARTKPYGFMPFTSGMGVGGHCIPVNPHYLFASCKKGALPLLERATKDMKKRPRKLARCFHRRVVLEMAKREGQRLTEMCKKQQPRMLVVGLGFKPGVSVLSFSPALAFATTLNQLGCARVSFYDPMVDEKSLGNDGQWLSKMSDAAWSSGGLKDTFDGIAVCVKQHGVDWSVIKKSRLGAGCYIRWYV